MLSGAVRRSAASVAARCGGRASGVDHLREAASAVVVSAPALVEGHGRAFSSLLGSGRAGSGGTFGTDPSATMGASPLGAALPRLDGDDDDNGRRRGRGRGRRPVSTRAGVGRHRSSLRQPRLAALRLSRRHYHATPPPSMPRKSGHRAFSKPRPATAKQRKTYNRKKRATYQEKVGKHSAPGSKAGPRREDLNEWWDDTLEKGRRAERNERLVDPMSPEELEYNLGDAMVDDLVGNSAELTAGEDPAPVWIGGKYHHHRRFLAEKMSRWHDHAAALESGLAEDGSDSGSDALVESMPTLPTDEEISVLLRSYRDKYSKPQRGEAIGLARALKLLLSGDKLDKKGKNANGDGASLPKVPMSAWGERTYSALASCCATPQEGVRVLRMLEDALASTDIDRVDHLFPDPTRARTYAHSILIHLHARAADFRGAAAALDNMSNEGIQPTLPAYTSLLSACRKVGASSSAPVPIKAEAGKVGWDRWKEMRVIGLEPDVMAYGAILRLLGSRGQPERAINVLEEMHVMGVKPTTLCFTAALQAVSRSHANAKRFSNARGKRGKHREKVAAHHGKLTREILIKAENADVTHDDGFVSALMGCAGVAGDAATVKAIYLASEVRRMTQLRGIGDGEHLEQLSGSAGGDSGDGALLQSGEALRGLLPGLEGADSDDLASAASRFIQKARRDAAEGKESALPPEIIEQLVAEMQDLNSSLSTPSERKQKAIHGGPDTRTTVALLTACADAAEPSGLGDLWTRDYEPTGRNTNLGYLDEFTLFLLPQYAKPKMLDKTFPGMTSWEVGQGAMQWDEEKEDVEKMSKRLRRSKFRGVEMDEDAGYTIEDVHPTIANMWPDWDPHNPQQLDYKTGEPLLEKGRPTHQQAVESGYYDDKGQKKQGWIQPGADGYGTVDLLPPGVNAKEAGKLIGGLEKGVETQPDSDDDGLVSSELEEGDDDDDVDWDEVDEDDDWDEDEVAAAVAHISRTEGNGDESSSPAVEANVVSSGTSDQQSVGDGDDEDEVDYYFDAKKGKWKTRPKGSSDDIKADTVHEAEVLQSVESKNPTSLPDERHLAAAMASGDIDLDGKLPSIEVAGPSVNDDDIDLSSLPDDQKVMIDDLLKSMPELEHDDFDSFFRELKEEAEEDGDDEMGDVTEEEARELFEFMKGERRAADAAGGGLLDASPPPVNGAGSVNDLERKLDPVDAEEAEWEKMLQEVDDGRYDGESDTDVADGEDPFANMDPNEFQAMLDFVKKDGKDGDGENGDVDMDQMMKMMSKFGGTKAMAHAKTEAVAAAAEEVSVDSKKELTQKLADDDLDEHDFEELMDVLDPKRKKQTETAPAAATSPAGSSDGVDDFDAKAQQLMKDLYAAEEGGLDGESPRLQPLVQEEGWSNEAPAATRVMDRPKEAVTGEMVPAEYDHSQETSNFPSFSDDPTTDASYMAEDALSEEDLKKDPITLQLERALPGLPPPRIERLRSLFERSLGDPSMLRLVPILRENMPPVAEPGWLKRKNLHDARLAMQTAEDEGRVDLPTLNAMLRVETTCGGLDRALAFHEREFAQNGLRPTGYSDRLVVEMLMKNHRLGRALEFKEKVERDGRTLDLLSYGNLVEYFGKRGQLGSSLLMLRECIAVHGSPPGEKAVKKLRSLCRQRGLDKEEMSLKEMIGEDPMEWLWEGNVKRRGDRSYRARREVKLPENRVLQI